jgi:hypothetical protein
MSGLALPLSSSLCAVVLLAGLGCQKTLGDALRPDDHTGAGAAGAELECGAAPGRIKPLVVDWDPDARVDLEAAMQGGVVVVKYECPNVVILPGCTVDGTYSYAGVSRKEQVIQMQNMDDVHANIPISSAKVGAEIQSGRAIDLATVLVGRRSTTVTNLSRAALSGDCEGATHFVRSASLGAFSMATGSKGSAGVVVEMFGYGAGASSDSTRQALNSDGNLDSCRTSDPSSPTPPDECQAPVRIDLIPVSEATSSVAADASDEEETKTEAAENPCMPGFVFAQGMCTRPTDAHAYLCASADEAECKTQCDKGSAESCFNLGRILARRTWMDDIGPARPPLEKACTAEIPESCTLLGEALWGMADPEADAAAADQAINQAYGFLMRGCQGGDGYGCELAGDIMSDNKLPSYDESAAFGLYSRACELGSGVGCSFAADRLFEGKGVAKNLERGLQTLLRSCEAGSVDECAEFGEILAEGRHGVTKDLKVATKFMAHACEVDVGWCEAAGDIAAKAGDAGLAKQMYQRDCDFDNESEACGKL